LLLGGPFWGEGGLLVSLLTVLAALAPEQDESVFWTLNIILVALLRTVLQGAWGGVATLLEEMV
jgi:hypothetical protein